MIGSYDYWLEGGGDPSGEGQFEWFTETLTEFVKDEGEKLGIEIDEDNIYNCVYDIAESSSSMRVNSEYAGLVKKYFGEDEKILTVFKNAKVAYDNKMKAEELAEEYNEALEEELRLAGM